MKTIRAGLPLLALLLGAGSLDAQDYRVGLSAYVGSASYSNLASDSTNEVLLSPGPFTGLQAELWFGRFGMRLNGGFASPSLQATPSTGFGIAAADLDLMARLRSPRLGLFFQPYAVLGAGAIRYDLGADSTTIGGELYEADPTSRGTIVLGLGTDLGSGPVSARIELMDIIGVTSPLSRADGSRHGAVQHVVLTFGLGFRTGSIGLPPAPEPRPGGGIRPPDRGTPPAPRPARPPRDDTPEREPPSEAPAPEARPDPTPPASGVPPAAPAAPSPGPEVRPDPGPIGGPPPVAPEAEARPDGPRPGVRPPVLGDPVAPPVEPRPPVEGPPPGADEPPPAEDPPPADEPPPAEDPPPADEPPPPADEPPPPADEPPAPPADTVPIGEPADTVVAPPGDADRVRGRLFTVRVTWDEERRPDAHSAADLARALAAAGIPVWPREATDRAGRTHQRMGAWRNAAAARSFGAHVARTYGLAWEWVHIARDEDVPARAVAASHAFVDELGRSGPESGRGRQR